MTLEEFYDKIEMVKRMIKSSDHTDEQKLDEMITSVLFNIGYLNDDVSISNIANDYGKIFMKKND